MSTEGVREIRMILFDTKPMQPVGLLHIVFFAGGIRGEEELSVLPDIAFSYPASREEGSREMASRRYAVLRKESY